MKRMRLAHRYFTEEHRAINPVAEWRTLRARRAAAICDWRAKLAIITDRIERRHLVRWFVERRISEAPPHPTATNLYLAAANSLESAGHHVARVGSHDTEYYSACGWDDYCIEAADWAYAYHVAYRIAARRMKWSTIHGFAWAA